MTTTIYQALCACFGLSPSSADASILIREAYQDPENAPRPPRNTDVIYFSVEPDSAAAEAPAAYSAENAAEASFSMAVSSFAAWRLQIICYGPHALTNARQIRAFLYADGMNMPRGILRKAGIRPIPDPPEPLLLHEPEGSLWRLRSDLTIQLRKEEKLTYTSRRNAIVIPPSVVINRS